MLYLLLIRSHRAAHTDLELEVLRLQHFSLTFDSLPQSKDLLEVMGIAIPLTAANFSRSEMSQVRVHRYDDLQITLNILIHICTYGYGSFIFMVG